MLKDVFNNEVICYVLDLGILNGFTGKATTGTFENTPRTGTLRDAETCLCCRIRLFACSSMSQKLDDQETGGFVFQRPDQWYHWL